MDKKYENILFDMDGVLINSMKYHILAWKLAFAKYNISTTEKRITEMAGMTSKETIELITFENNISCNNELFENVKTQKGIELDKIFKVELYSDVLEYLNKLKNSGFKLALVSGARRHEVEITIKKYFIDLFDIVISGDDVKFGKPNSEPYQKVVDKLNLDKSKTVIIEDALSGIQSANAAGIEVFALTTTFSAGELVGATKIFNSHKELFEELLKK